MIEITKKDGKKEAFNPEKIKKSIAGAAQQADIPNERKDEVVNQVAGTVISMLEGKEEINVSEIREMILNELDKVEPAVSSSWRKYEQEKKKVE